MWNGEDKVNKLQGQDEVNLQWNGGELWVTELRNGEDEVEDARTVSVCDRESRSD